MADSSNRVPVLRAPVLRQTRSATTMQPLNGGRVASNIWQPRRRRAARCRHSAQELSLLALCAVAVTGVAGLLVFTILRDSAYLDRSAPLSVPLKP